MSNESLKPPTTRKKKDGKTKKAQRSPEKFSMERVERYDLISSIAQEYTRTNLGQLLRGHAYKEAIAARRIFWDMGGRRC